MKARFLCAVVTFGILVVSTFGFAAGTVTPKTSTGAYKIEKGKPKKVGTAAAGKALPFLSQTKKKDWVLVSMNGDKVWLKATAVTVSGDRSTASTSTASVGGAAPTKILLGGGPGIQTGGTGFGLGVGGTYNVLDKVTTNPLEVGATFYFYPGSVTSWSFSGLASTMLVGTQTKGFGPEAGLVMFSTSVDLGIFGSVSSTNVGLSLGGLGRYPLSETVFLNGGMRLLVMSGTALQFHAGVQFSL